MIMERNYRPYIYICYTKRRCTMGDMESSG